MSGRGDSSYLKSKRCVTCGAEFKPTIGFQKYCGPDCRHEAEKIDRVCKHCGEVFRRPRASRAAYCSHACSNKAAAAKRKGGQGRFGMGIKTGAFPRPRNCHQCGREYAQKKGDQKFCSRHCMMAFRHAAYRKENPVWSLRTKGEELCRNCGDRAVNLHHIVPRSKSKAASRDVARNGLPLCFSCHRGWHDRKVEIYRGCLRPEEIAYAIEIAGEWWLDKNYPVPPDVELVALYAAAGGGQHLEPGWQQRQAQRIAEARDIPY